MSISFFKQSGDVCKLDGLHVVANLYRCRGEARYLTDAAALRQFCHASIQRSGLTVLGELFHEFDGGGVTGTVVLAESHLAIHTWPEYGYAAVDVFTCGDLIDPKVAANYLIEKFQSQNPSILEIKRGVLGTEKLPHKPMAQGELVSA